MCCSVIVVRVFFQQSHPISTYKAGLSDVLLFVIPRVRVFFNSPTHPYEAGIEWCAALVTFMFG
jgi:hypothetical protein